MSDTNKDPKKITAGTSAPTRALAVRRADGSQAILPAHLVHKLRGVAQSSEKPGSAAKRSALEVTFFCDTTGSMYEFFDRAREGIELIADRLDQEGVDVKFAAYAYKNHQDEGWFGGEHPFAHQPLSANPVDLKSALAQVRKGGGGDGLCAIEDAFHHCNKRTSATGTGAARVGVVVGDMPPHGVVDLVSKCPHEYDYREEVGALHTKGFTFYSVFCFEESDLFYKNTPKIQEYFRWLASQTGGKYLELAELESLVDVLLGICMKATGKLEKFTAEVMRRPNLPASTRKALLMLSDGKSG